MAHYLSVDAAESLPKDKLVELVLRQQDQIQRLEEQLAALQRAGKRQAAPFGREKPKAEPQKAGRKPGQGRFTYRPAPAPEAVTTTKTELLQNCPDCGGVLSEVQEHEHYEEDIPRVQPIITRFVSQSGYCAHCRKRQRSRHPEQLSQAAGAAGVSVGPRAIALAVDLKHRLGLSYEKSTELFQQAFGLSVSRSALCQADQRLAVKALPVYEELVATLRQSAQVHADETSWRIGGLSAWLWVFTNRNLTVYTIESGLGHARSHQVIVKMLGEKFLGTLISDCFSAYDHEKFDGWLKQKCIGHLLKDLSNMEAAKAGKALCFGRQVATVLRQALALRDDKPQLSLGQFQHQVRCIEARLDGLIAPHRRLSDPDNNRFAKRLRKHRVSLLRFLYQDGLDATNNQAERMLRPAVIVRKTGGCNRTAKGAINHGVLTSVLVTARQQGLSLLAVMEQLQRATTEAFCLQLIPSLAQLVVPP